MLRILGEPTSINVRKVLWTCDEIGVGYSREAWGGGARPTSDPEFLAFNPKALTPVLIDGDAVITESNTIVRYLACKQRRHDLLPEGARERARVEEVMDWQATDFNTAWRIAFQALVRRAPTGMPIDDARVAGSIEAWTAMLARLDARLARNGPYVCGETFTVADIVIGLSVNRWLRAPLQRPSFVAVDSYFDRLMRRPAAQPYLGENSD